MLTQPNPTEQLIDGLNALSEASLLDKGSSDVILTLAHAGCFVMYDHDNDKWLPDGCRCNWTGCLHKATVQPMLTLRPGDGVLDSAKIGIGIKLCHGCSLQLNIIHLYQLFSPMITAVAQERRWPNIDVRRSILEWLTIEAMEAKEKEAAEAAMVNLAQAKRITDGN